MKNQETPAQMDEIVFEHRNKKYGAYILRKMYNKHLFRALFMSSAILIAGLAYPLVSSYNAVNSEGHFVPDGGIIFSPDNVLPPEPPVLPPPPPPVSELAKRLVFIAPIVVEGIVPDDPGIDMGLINERTSNIPVTVTEEPVGTKKEEVIDIKTEEPPVIFAEEMPSFPGGESERIKFLYENLHYPGVAAEIGIQGTVFVQFVIDSKGNITDFKIQRGIGGGCDEEAERVIRMMPQWHPGKQNGKTVRVLYNMSVAFKLKS